MSCYACDDDATTGTCDRTHHHEAAVVDACERHRDDHDEQPSDELIKELIAQGRIGALKSRTACSAGHGAKVTPKASNALFVGLMARQRPAAPRG